ncbi:MAG: DUF6328 family protein [Actinomycetota bacterium]
MTSDQGSGDTPLDEAVARADEEEPDEDPKERLNRKLIEVLNELRVGLPGVQVLFAFLLTLPFTAEFGKISPFQRDVYAVSLFASAVASLLMIAPAAYHRHRFATMQHETVQAKLEMLVTQGRLAIAGLATFAISMSLVVFLVFDVILSLRWAGLGAGTLALGFLWFWYGLPISRRRRDPTQP